ncbi:PA14 domain-containing protein [Chryseobacterium limigenitum]|uniref:PA14 domain-containing protein n=1 Tax=Chryseobacterium limigenitum TaxID=1612149 RepID=UPI003391EAA5
MRYKFKYMYLLLPLLLLLVTINVKAQYPGGVSTGTTRGYKVDYYNGTFSDQTGFGAGTSNAVPSLSEYSNKVTGTEFQPIDADYYGLEYSGTLEIPVSGNYTFSLSADDRAWLYIDGTLVVQAISGSGTATSGVSLTAGDHTIKVKYYELGGANSAVLQVANGPSGSNITAATDVDGRFVRYNNAKLTGWYKGSDLNVTANYGGAGIDKVNTMINKAPDYAGNGNLNYSSSVSGGYATVRNDISQVNFNPGVRFDGDDTFSSGSTIKGLSLRGATKTMFFVNSYVSNIGQAGNWMYFHGDATSNQRIGFYKNDGTGNQLAVVGAGVTNASAYTAGEPKLLGGFVDQVTGGTAPSGTNPLSLRSNGNAGTTASLLSYADHDANGLVISNMNAAHIPEAIYYPFALSQIEERKVNTYLAVKYGITLAHDYINTSGATVFGLTTNTGYTNRIFGIGRELAVEGLNQKQSQSQMTSTTGYDFLVVSKGAVAASNTANSGGNMTTDNSYLLMGDNAGSFTPQSTDVSSTLSTSCQFNRIGREWKAQVTGTPGAVTVRAGSSTAGSFIFPGNASGIVMIVDTDNDGDFSNATTTYQPSSVVNGVAAFDNVTLVTGNVITFGWTVTAPGGVSAGLKLWSKADDTSLATGNVAQWNDLSTNANHLTRSGNANVTKIDNRFNYNPAVRFTGTDNQFLESINALGMNASNTYAEFYVLKGLGVSGIAFDEFITLGAGNTSGTSHRWENSSTNFATGKYAAFGNGTPQNQGTGSLTMGLLGLYNNSHSGTAAILRVNSDIVWTNTTTQALSLSGNFRIGTDVNAVDGDTNYNAFDAPELIVYSTALSATDIQKINSYLGIKYSIPLSDGSGTSASNYLASDGTVIWTGKATYKFGMFGIGRDDCSGLVQKQSKAYIEGTDNVKFGLTKLATTNAENTGTFAANKQFIIVANDGGAFTGTTSNVASSYPSTSCNPYRYVRSWKVQNTNATTSPLQMTIGDTTNPIASNWSNVTLAINSAGDNTFATGTTTLVVATSVIGGVATFDNVNLPDGAVFTVYYTLGFPGGVSKPSAGISITTVSGTTTNNVNGLEYKLYSTNGTAGTGISTGFSAYAPTLLSSGYYHNATDFHAFVNAKIGDNYGIELTGKLNVATATATYQFRGNASDDQFALIIDGNVIINQTAFGTVTSANVTLAAGYHDIIIRGRELAGGQKFDLQWNGGSGSTFTAIPDANFFTSPQGPSAWYGADDSILSAAFAEGATVTAWNDLSSNGNNLVNSGNPVYYNSNKTYITNYNPSIYFTGDYFGSGGSNYINGFAYGKQGKSSFAVGSNNNAGGETIYTGYGLDIANNNFGLTKLTTGKLQLFGSGNVLTEAGTFYGSATVTTDILSGIYSNGNISGAGINAYLYANGLQRASASKPTWDTKFNDNGQLNIGNSPDYGSTFWYNKNLNEIIHYPWDLSAIERQKLNSYLGIKWGITLEQTVATNYLASDGSTIWDAATAATFKNDITGIGRDDCGALYQKQSTSTDGDDIVAMGLGSTGLAANNPQNANTFSANKQFLTWAHNGASVLTTNSTNLPVSLISAASCYTKMDRVWQTQVTNNTGNVSIEVGKQDLFVFSASNYNPVLLIGDSPTDFTNATVIQPAKVSDGKAYFNDVAFTGVQYFTIAYIPAGPGGVRNNLGVWINADNEVYTDIAQTVPASASGDKVVSVNNLIKSGNFKKVEAPGSLAVSEQPNYIVDGLSYIPAIDFPGYDIPSRLTTPNAINSLDYRSANAITSIITIRQDPILPPATPGYEVRAWDHNNTRVTRGYSKWGTNANVDRSSWVNKSELYTFTNSTTGNTKVFSNLKLLGSGTSTSTATENYQFTIGNNAAGDMIVVDGYPTFVAMRFKMSEMIIYKDDKSLNSDEFKRIHSYLALKYSYTLDQTLIGGSYISSNGTVMYDYTDYWHDITGIGRDDCSTLNKKQSKGIENYGGLVAISHDPNGLAVNNLANPANFSQNMSFLTFGDNNKSLNWNASDNIQDPTTSVNLMRLNRVWRVKETGSVGTVYLEAPANTSTATTKLPAPANSPSDPMYLIVANTASGGIFNNPTIVAMTPKGTDWAVTYDFANGDYYTFATLESCLAPAGITDGLTTWYRADNKTDGAQTTFNDESGNHNLTKNGGGTANIIAGTASSNYNKFLTLSNASMTKTGVTEQALTANNAGTLYGVALGNNNSRLFTNTRSGNATILLSTTSNSAQWNNGTILASYAALAATSIPNIWNMNYNGSQLVASSNGLINNTTAGAVTLGASTTNQVSIGAGYAGTTYTYNNNTFGEAFSFNRSLSIAETQLLDSYLAIKYGQTLSHNYYSPDYNGINAAAAIIYNVSTYGNRVFGVGNHIGGCFYQNQSTSPLSGSMLKISVDGILNAENSKNPASWIEDQSYIIMGDNNGALPWVTTNKPIIEASNTCLFRITRQWKVVSTKQNPVLLVTIPDSTSSSATKLDPVPVNNDVYMVISDQEDFTSVTASQQIIKMALNNTTKEWEATGTFDANTTRYITFVYKPMTCGLPCVPVNPATSRSHIK